MAVCSQDIALLTKIRGEYVNFDLNNCFKNLFIRL